MIISVFRWAGHPDKYKSGHSSSMLGLDLNQEFNQQHLNLTFQLLYILDMKHNQPANCNISNWQIGYAIMLTSKLTSETHDENSGPNLHFQAYFLLVRSLLRFPQASRDLEVGAI